MGEREGRYDDDDSWLNDERASTHDPTNPAKLNRHHSLKVLKDHDDIHLGLRE